MNEPTAAALLAQLATSVRSETLPGDVVTRSKLAIADCLGVAIAGTREQAPRVVASVAGHADGQATVIGQARGADPLTAALVNGALAHVLDFDDTYLPAIYHGTSPALAAALAVAEHAGRSGRELIAAHVAGYEVGTRVACALYPEHVERGWHITATAGTLGACAAAGRVLGLGEDELAAAYALAATQAAGLRAMLGTMAKSLHVGKAAANGLLAALLASRGFDGDPLALDRPQGFFDALGDGREAARRLERSGGEFLLRQNTIKAYPCAILIHPAIRASLACRDRVRPDAVERATVGVCESVPVLVGRTAPGSGLAAKFSTSYCVALALVKGSPAVPDFSDEAVGDPTVGALERRVVLEPRPDIPKDGARLAVRLGDGTVVEETWQGELTASEEETRAKFLALAMPVLGSPRSQELLDLLMALETLPMLTPLTELLRWKGERP